MSFISIIEIPVLIWRYFDEELGHAVFFLLCEQSYTVSAKMCTSKAYNTSLKPGLNGHPGKGISWIPFGFMDDKPPLFQVKGLLLRQHTINWTSDCKVLWYHLVGNAEPQWVQLFRWPYAKETWLQCISNGITSFCIKPSLYDQHYDINYLTFC